MLLGSSVPHSVASLGSNKLITNGLKYAISSDAAACSPGVLKTSQPPFQLKIQAPKIDSGCFKWKPQYQNKVEIRNDELMQRWNPGYNEYLEEEYDEDTDDIFNNHTHSLICFNCTSFISSRKAFLQHTHAVHLKNRLQFLLSRYMYSFPSLAGHCLPIQCVSREETCQNMDLKQLHHLF